MKLIKYFVFWIKIAIKILFDFKNKFNYLDKIISPLHTFS